MQIDPGRGVALEQADDAFLVARATDGDPDAFGVLLRRHSTMLRGYVTGLTRNRADVDDVLQETAIDAWQHLDALRDGSKVRSWLVRIATRESFRLIDARSDDLELRIDDVVAVSDAEVDRLDLQRDLIRALGALPAQQARCWLLREVGGYRYGEIAEQLGVPESTVRGSLAAARKSIITSMGGSR